MTARRRQVAQKLPALSPKNKKDRKPAKKAKVKAKAKAVQKAKAKEKVKAKGKAKAKARWLPREQLKRVEAEEAAKKIRKEATATSAAAAKRKRETDIERAVKRKTQATEEGESSESTIYDDRVRQPSPGPGEAIRQPERELEAARTSLGTIEAGEATRQSYRPASTGILEQHYEDQPREGAQTAGERRKEREAGNSKPPESGGAIRRPDRAALGDARRVTGARERGREQERQRAQQEKTRTSTPREKREYREQSVIDRDTVPQARTPA